MMIMTLTSFIMGQCQMSLPIESLHTPFYLMAIVKVPLPPICHHLRDFRNKNVYGLDLDLYNGSRTNVNMSNKI